MAAAKTIVAGFPDAVADLTRFSLPRIGVYNIYSTNASNHFYDIRIHTTIPIIF
jgi:hypothetical protein